MSFSVYMRNGLRGGTDKGKVGEPTYVDARARARPHCGISADNGVQSRSCDDECGAQWSRRGCNKRRTGSNTSCESGQWIRRWRDSWGNFGGENHNQESDRLTETAADTEYFQSIDIEP